MAGSNKYEGMESVDNPEDTKLSQPFHYQHVPLKSELNVGALPEGVVFDIDEDRAQEMCKEASVDNSYAAERDLYQQKGTSTDAMAECDSDHDYFENTSIMADISASRSGAVMKHIHKAADSCAQKPKKGDLVKIHHISYCEGLDEPFDNSRLKEQPVFFRLGQGQVIHGLDMAVASMQLGEVAIFVLAPECAYGPLGAPPRIPPDCRVKIIVWLLDIIAHTVVESDGGAVADDNLGTEGILKKVDEVKKICKDLLSEVKVGKGDYQKAFRYYRYCMNLLEPCLVGEEARGEVHAYLQSVYNSAALCLYRLEKFDSTISMARQALKLEAAPVAKTQYFIGKAYLAKGDSDKASEHLVAAKKLCRGKQTRDLDEAFTQLHILKEKEKKEELELARKMMSFTDKSEEGGEKSCKASSFLQQVADEDAALHDAPIGESTKMDQEKVDEMLKLVDDNFKRMITAQLLQFKADRSMKVLPLPKVSLNFPQIVCLTNEAMSMGFDLELDEQSGMIKVMKRKKKTSR